MSEPEAGSEYIVDTKAKRAQRRFEDVSLPTGGKVRLCSLTGLDLTELGDVPKGELMVHAFLMCWVDGNGHRIHEYINEEMVEDIRNWDAADLTVVFKAVESFCMPKRSTIEKKS